MPQNAAENAAPTRAAATKPKTTDRVAPIGARCPCANKAGGWDWESPNVAKINMVEAAQELARLHFTVCDTNPILVHKSKDREH